MKSLLSVSVRLQNKNFHVSGNNCIAMWKRNSRAINNISLNGENIWNIKFGKSEKVSMKY